MFRIKVATTTPKTQNEEGAREMKKNNATTMSIATKKEETKMKKATTTAATKKANTNTNKEETTMKKTTVATKSTTNKEEKNMKNSLTINGIEITLSPEQSAAIAAMLMGGTTTASAPAPRGRKAKEVKAEPKEQAESVKKAAAEPFTDFKVLLAESRFSFAKGDGTFLYQKAPRQALNSRLKAVCESKGLSVKYNKEFWAWEVLNPRTGKVPGKTVLAGIVKELSVPVSTEELAAVYAEWEAAKAKRAAK